MKVTLPKDYRNIFTLDDLDRAKAVIASCKEDTTTLKELAEIAVREVLRGEKYGWCDEVLKAEAYVAKNSRIQWNYYADNSLNMDVWIDFTAEWGTGSGFVKGGAYLSDIWSGQEFRQHTYRRIYREDEY